MGFDAVLDEAMEDQTDEALSVVAAMLQRSVWLRTLQLPLQRNCKDRCNSPSPTHLRRIGSFLKTSSFSFARVLPISINATSHFAMRKARTKEERQLISLDISDISLTQETAIEKTINHI